MKKSNYQMSAYLKGDTPITVALALEHIANVTKNSHLNEDSFELLHRETEYLNRQLDINKIQAFILAVVLSEGCSTYTLDLCNHAKISKIFAISLQPDLEYLIKRGLLKACDVDENFWNHRFAPTATLLNAVRYNTLPY